VGAIPPLSIGFPVYNGEAYLADSIEALLGQTFEDFELIISDNDSTDGTADICRFFEGRDSRVRYLRHRANIGAVPNHHYVFQQSLSPLFKWAAADDLYARDLLERCIGVLDERRDVVLAHSWTAAMNGEGRITQTLEYPLATDSLRAPERFRSMLFGSGEYDGGMIRADDFYGVIRADVLRQVLPQGSYYHSDKTLTAAIALYGPFCQIPAWLYFRRDHRDRPQYAFPTVRGWCTNLDPHRADRLRHPTVRLLGEYPLGYLAAIRRAPLSAAEKRECYCDVARWVGSQMLSAAGRVQGQPRRTDLVPVPTPSATVSIDAVVAGRAGEHL
jgi:glycosyltransferase involved in cell wall biosynthesis